MTRMPWYVRAWATSLRIPEAAAAASVGFCRIIIRFGARRGRISPGVNSETGEAVHAYSATVLVCFRVCLRARVVQPVTVYVRSNGWTRLIILAAY